MMPTNPTFSDLILSARMWTPWLVAICLLVFPIITLSSTPQSSLQKFQDSLFSPTIFAKEAIASVCGQPSHWVSNQNTHSDEKEDNRAPPFVPFTKVLEINDSPATYEECAFLISQRYFSVKQGEFYGLVPLLDDEINRRLLEFGARKFNPLHNHLEGNIMGYPDKYAILQTYANDERVETICEIGLNSGYSTLFMTLQNPNAKFIEFDIFYHNYTAVALSSLQEFFPTRDYVGIAGDSSISVQRFHRLFPHVMCNLLFIDGGHSTEALRADIEQMAHLANRSYHRVIIDDTTMHNNLYQEYFKFVKVNVSEDRERGMYGDKLGDILAQRDREGEGERDSDGVSRQARIRHIAHYVMNASDNACFTWEMAAFVNPLHNYVNLKPMESCVIGQHSELYEGSSGVSIGEYLFDDN